MNCPYIKIVYLNEKLKRRGHTLPKWEIKIKKNVGTGFIDV